VTLFATSLNLVSALIGTLLLVTTTESSTYPRIVHVSLIPLTISAIAIKNRVTLKTAGEQFRFLFLTRKFVCCECSTASVLTMIIEPRTRYVLLLFMFYWIQLPCPSVCPSVRLSVRPSVRPSVCPSVCTLFFPSFNLRSPNFGF
jgi:hypothetical protein